MNLPKHYKQAWRLMIRSALLMIAVGLLFGILDFQIIAESMFGENELLRGASYAISHILMGSGLSAVALSLWFSLKNSERINE